MLFASTALVSRIEAADRSLIAESVEALSRRQPELDVMLAPLAGGVAAWAGDGSPFNKVAGVGFDGPLDEAALAEVERALAQRGSPVQFELASLAEPSISAALTRRGYLLQGFENVLGRSLSPEDDPAPRADAEIAVSPPQELDAWLDTLVTGFATPDAQGLPSHESFPRGVIERAMGAMASSHDFVRYVARRSGALAGGAGLRLSGGVAQLCGAATLPEHRNRGIQTALLAERLAASARAGCELAVVTTQPGSKSQQNAQRRGFELLYTRAVLVREP